MPKDNSIKSVLIIGSGPIVIGQACEFDYAGSQSARSLREEGIEVILINSNPATIMTDPSMADHVYLKPLTTKSIIEILKAHPQIDAVLPTMGGQTALNLCIEADEKGIWKDFGVKLIGVDINAINITEDREQFKNLLNKIGVPQAPAKTANSFLQGKEIEQEFGFPLVIRPSFTLGGTGAAIVYKKEDFETVLSGYDVVLNSQDSKTLAKSLNVLKPGGKLISISGPPDPAFGEANKAPAFIKLVMRLLSAGIRRKAKRRGISYSFLFMKANGNQLSMITSLFNEGIMRPVVDRVFPFERTNDALEYVETGRAKGKVVIRVR